SLSRSLDILVPHTFPTRRSSDLLGFELEPTTFEAIKENHNLLEKISVERITIEFVKLLLGEFRNLGLEMLLASQCYQYCPGLARSEEHTSELQSRFDLVCRLLLE